MSEGTRCSVARMWLVRLAVALVLGLPQLLLAGVYFNTPYYFQVYDAKQNLVRYDYDQFDSAVDNAKKYLAASYPASNPSVCLPQSAFEDDASRIASGYVAKVSYASTDPKVSCPTNVLNIQLTQYNNDPEKNTGDAGNCDGGIGVSGGDGIVTCAGTTFIGDPINVATGNKYVQETDVELSPWLTFRRFYNSQGGTVRKTTLGPQWRHSFDRALSFLNTMPNGKGASYILVQRPDGRSERFRAGTNGSWVSDPNIADTLTSDSTGYTLFVAGPNQFERYSTSGQLQYVMDQSGQSATLTYNGAQLQSVTDPQGRALRFTYDGNGLLRTLTVPDGGVLTYSYQDGVLATAQYQDGKARNYVYNESANTSGQSFPYALTGIIDEKGTRYETTGYNAKGLAVSTGHAGGADAVTIANVGSSGATATSPLGAPMQYFMSDDGYGAIKLTSTFTPCHTAWCNQRWMTINYDANGYPKQYLSLASITTNVVYNSSGLETQRVEAVGMTSQGWQRTINTTWDTVLRVPLTRTTLDSNNAAVAKAAWTYNASGQVTARCDIDPNTAGAMSYNCGSATSAPAGVRQWRYSYCTKTDSTQCPVIGLVLSEDGPRTDVSDVTRYSYYLSTDESGCGKAGGACHRAGDTYQIIDALGHTTTYIAYDKAGRVTRMTDANGVITDLGYTPRGWLQTRSVSGAVTTYTYTPYGALASVTDADNVAITYNYDDAHRLTDITDALGNRIHYTLDAAGNHTDEAVYAAGSSTPSRHVSQTFNNLGQLIKTVDGLNHTVFDASGPNNYDAAGRLFISVDALGVKRQRSYDSLGRLWNVTDNATVNGAAKYSTFNSAYDVLDRVTKSTPPGGGLVNYMGSPTSYTYDGLGNTKALQSPDTGTTTFTYDAAGNAVSRTDAKGATVATSYDAVNRPVSVTYSDNSLNITYRYDEANGTTGCSSSYPVGRLTRIIEAKVTTVYCYDARGNITQKSQAQNASTYANNYAYTPANRLAAIGYSSGSFAQYARDKAGRVTAITLTSTSDVQGAVVVSGVTYLPFGPVAKYTLGNGQTITRSYDANYALTDVLSPVINLHFARNNAGHITATGSGPGANPLTESYGYDWLSHLTSVNNAAGTTLESYTYDDVGNRLSKTGSGLATGIYTYGYAPNTNWLKATGNAARSLDANGNTTASNVGGETFGFGYNGRNRLTVVQRNGSTVGTYTYNALGQRVGKVATFPASVSQYYLYDENSQLLGEYGDATRDYIWLDGIPVAVSDTTLRGGLSFSVQTTTNYVHADGLNTPRAITDASGKVQWQWSYTGNPFGEQLPTSSTGFVYNLRYAGQYYDAESGLMDNINRTYEPATGRYLQSDPTGLRGGWSTYAYVGGNPLSAIDGLGLAANGAAIGCGVGGGVGATIGAAGGGAAGGAGGLLCGPGAVACSPAAAGALGGAGWVAGGAIGCAAGAVIGSATEDLLHTAGVITAHNESTDGTNSNVIAFPKSGTRPLPNTCPGSGDDKEGRCMALKQSILATCSGLSDRKRFACYEAANESYRQCMED